MAGSVTVQPGEILRGRGVRTLDARRDLSLVAVAQLRQIRRAPVVYRGKEIPVTAVIGVDFTASEVQVPELKTGG